MILTDGIDINPQISYADLIVINCNKCQEGKELGSMRTAGGIQSGFRGQTGLSERGIFKLRPEEFQRPEKRTLSQASGTVYAKCFQAVGAVEQYHCLDHKSGPKILHGFLSISNPKQIHE